MSRAGRRFFIGVYKKGTEVTGYASSYDPSRLLTLPESHAHPDDHPLNIADTILTFSSLLTSFVSIMESYRKFIPLMLGMAPIISSMLAERRIGRFAKGHGQRHDLSNET